MVEFSALVESPIYSLQDIKRVLRCLGSKAKSVLGRTGREFKRSFCVSALNLSLHRMQVCTVE